MREETILLKKISVNLNYRIMESESDAGDYVTMYGVDGGTPQAGRSVSSPRDRPAHVRIQTA